MCVQAASKYSARAGTGRRDGGGRGSTEWDTKWATEGTLGANTGLYLLKQFVGFGLLVP